MSSSSYQVAVTMQDQKNDVDHTLLKYEYDPKIFANDWVISEYENHYDFSTDGETYQVRIKHPLLWSEFDTSLIIAAILLGLLIMFLVILQVKVIVKRNNELYQRNAEIEKIVKVRTEELAVEKERAQTRHCPAPDDTVLNRA